MSTFASMLAVDENGYIANDATGQVFAPTDTAATTALDVTDLNGIAYAGNTVIASTLGVLPSFRCTGFNEVHWVSGDFRIPVPCIDQVPQGGASGQVLTKSSNSNYDTQWKDPISQLPTGGTDGQALVKDGSANFAVKWGTATGGGGVTTVDYTNIPAGSTITLRAAGATYPARPTTRTDVIVRWRGSSPPAIGGTGAINGIDEWVNTTP